MQMTLLLTNTRSGEGDDGTIERKKRVLSNRQPLTAMRLYNHSPGVAHYANFRVQYSPHTSRDGDFFNSEEAVVPPAARGA